MCISQCPRSLIKMNVVQTRGCIFLLGKQAKGEKVGLKAWLLMLVHVMKLHSASTSKKVRSGHVFNFMITLQSAHDKTLSCMLLTVVMTLIRSSHRGASSLFMCSWCVRWNQSRPGRARRKTLAGRTTPHCSFPPACPADVTERVGWWSTLIPSWESAEGESRPETHLFNPGRFLPPYSGRWMDFWHTLVQLW